MSAKLPPVTRLRRAYARATRRAGGDWAALVTLDGRVAVDDRADRKLKAYSIQKMAIAAALLAKVDRGGLGLGQKIRLGPADVLGGSGLYHLQPVHGDDLTVAGVLTALLTLSDNTAVRLCGRLVPGPEINDVLSGLGLTHTRVEPTADPARFFLGDTTPRETHDLLARLTAGTLLARETTAFLLGALRSAAGYHDGVRHELPGPGRARVATKHGADRDERGAARHEAGVIFTADDRPALIYALFADALGTAADYGPTHPAVAAHADLGRVMLECC
ncbi:serine hydrolase [Dactylosporangium sp. CA-233914]|uniref:serine hydrolase n=1 Tax=Dactylosporangium sp. CA-233914 TaxID=3239934 RepID=UPI003D926C9F